MISGWRDETKQTQVAEGSKSCAKYEFIVWTVSYACTKSWHPAM